ncbi:MAG TPA: DUF2281 domain-containing protein [bacterium]|nr:DUF2281 domain-containing protein [bacterium]
MTRRELLLHEIEGVPDPVLEEVLDFIHHLKARAGKDGLDTAIASESSLAKDWLRPEEDEAWRNL